MGAFLVLESREHAQARGAKPRARISQVFSDRNPRKPGEAEASLRRQWDAISPRVDRSHAAFISGAAGLEPATSAELHVLKEIGLPVRNTGTYIGHGVDTQFMANLGIGCAVVEHGKLFAPIGSGDVGESPADLSQVVVTSVGNWRGEGLALLERGRLRRGLMTMSTRPTASARRDKAGRPVIAVTGMGVLTSLGIGKTDNWAKLTAGKSGIRRISRFPLDSLRTTIAGTVDDVYKDYMPPAELSERIARARLRRSHRASRHWLEGSFSRTAVSCAAAARDRMALPHPDGREGRAGPRRAYSDLMRVAREPKFAPIYETLKYGIIGEHLAAHFGTEGSPISLTTACASGGTAIQLGVEAIRRGECQAVLAVGADGSLTPESLVRFSLLSALSTQNDPPEQASKPFSKNRDGFVLAEGAGALVLEDYDHAIARGAKVLAILEGCGEKSDSFHRTRSSPDGKPVIACMRNALADAGVGPEDIDYINAHGTSTPENDKMECLGVSTVFGERIRSIPMSSNKSMIGHTLTAAGAVEAVFTALTLEHQRIPPTINHRMPDPAIPLDVVPNVARDARINRAISNSFGFGGQNISLVLTREPA